MNSTLYIDVVLNIANCGVASLSVWLLAAGATWLNSRATPRFRHNLLMGGCCVALVVPAAQQLVAATELGLIEIGTQQETWIFEVLALTWCGVSVLLLSRLLIDSVAVWRMRRSLTETSDQRYRRIIEQAATHVGLKTPVPISTPNLKLCPMVVGLFRPIVVIPHELGEKLSDDQLRCVLVHECAHICRRDPWTALLYQLARCAYWWNPFCLLVGRQLEEMRERACDDRVSTLDTAAHCYASSLLRVAEWVSGLPKSRAAALSLVGGTHDLVHRVRRLGRPGDTPAHLSPHRILLALASVVVMVVASGMPAFSGKGGHVATHDNGEPFNVQGISAETAELLAQEHLAYIRVDGKDREDAKTLASILNDKRHALRRGIIVDMRGTRHFPFPSREILHSQRSAVGNQLSPDALSVAVVLLIDDKITANQTFELSLSDALNYPVLVVSRDDISRHADHMTELEKPGMKTLGIDPQLQMAIQMLTHV